MGEKPSVIKIISAFTPLVQKIFAVMLVTSTLTGCGIFNPGKFLGVVKTDPDEEFYLVERAELASSASSRSKTRFDHTLDETVNLLFVPANEKNRYISKTIWYDPGGYEFRTIRHTHDRVKENPDSIGAPKKGTPRVHSMPLSEMWDHKKGLWKVELYLDGKLARRLKFHVR